MWKFNVENKVTLGGGGGGSEIKLLFYNKVTLRYAEQHPDSVQIPSYSFIYQNRQKTRKLCYLLLVTSVTSLKKIRKEMAVLWLYRD